MCLHRLVFDMKLMHIELSVPRAERKYASLYFGWIGTYNLPMSNSIEAMTPVSRFRSNGEGGIVSNLSESHQIVSSYLQVSAYPLFIVARRILPALLMR